MKLILVGKKKSKFETRIAQTFHGGFNFLREIRSSKFRYHDILRHFSLSFFFFLFLSREVESFEYKFKREICSWHRPPVESIQNVTREECGGFMATQRNIWRTCTFSLPSLPPLIRSYDSASLISVIYKKRFFLRPFHGNANDSTTE